MEVKNILNEDHGSGWYLAVEHHDVFHKLGWHRNESDAKKARQALGKVAPSLLDKLKVIKDT